MQGVMYATSHPQHAQHSDQRPKTNGHANVQQRFGVPPVYAPCVRADLSKSRMECICTRARSCESQQFKLKCTLEATLELRVQVDLLQRSDSTSALHGQHRLPDRRVHFTLWDEDHYPPHSSRSDPQSVDESYPTDPYLKLKTRIRFMFSLLFACTATSAFPQRKRRSQPARPNSRIRVCINRWKPSRPSQHDFSRSL